MSAAVMESQVRHIIEAVPAYFGPAFLLERFLLLFHVITHFIRLEEQLFL